MEDIERKKIVNPALQSTHVATVVVTSTLLVFIQEKTSAAV
jgi:hypothetical protein